MKKHFLPLLSFISVLITLHSCKDQEGTVARLRTHSRSSTCIKGRGDCMLAIENEGDQRTSLDGSDRISLKKLSDSTIQIDYTQKAESEDGEGGSFFVGNDILIPQTTCKSLGQSKIRIKAGEYKIDRSKNSLGTILVKAIVE